MYKKITSCFILILILCASVFSQTAPDYYADDVYFITGVDSGLGGPYPTDNSGLESLFANPAAFKSADEELSITNTTILLTGPIFDIATLVISSLSSGGDFATILASPSTQSILSGLYSGFSMTGPLFFGYVGDGFGFGLFNSTDFHLRSKGALSLAMNFSEKVFLAGGYAFRIPLSQDETHAIDIGVMLKGGVEGEVVIEKSFLELPAMLASLGPDLLLGEQFEFSTIIGLDLGALYTWEGFLSAGLSLQDVFSPTVKYTYATGINGFIAADDPIIENGLIPFKLNVGVEINPTIPFLEQWVTNLRFMAAYDDVLDFLLYPTEATNMLLHIKTGLEITMLDILDIRLGLAEGLLNAGFGLDLQIFTLNAAMFGSELSSQPGTNPVYNLVVGFSI
ncbi:MAG: hypothetical protein JEZ04_15975 [Spirochaetales bacterium]|nr:hypothetical protein [Spirochaetales bacterium]